MTVFEFTEMLIFRSSCSQMFFKISFLKSFAILEPLSNNEVTDLLLQNTYLGWFWIFVAANTFLQLNLVFIVDSRTGFSSGLLWKHELNLRSSHWSYSVKRVILEHFANFTGKRLCWSLFLIELQTFHRCFLVKLVIFLRTPNLKSANDCFGNLFFSLGLPFLIYSFVCQFSLHYYWYCYNQKQSSGGPLQKRCSNKFRKFHKKTLALKTRFQWSCGSTEFNFNRKEIPAHMFFCELWEISHKTFFKKRFARLLLHKHSFCLLSKHDLVPFQKRCHTYIPAKHFLGLIYRLGTRVSSIFQTLSYKPIFNPVQHLWWSCFRKIVSSLKLFRIFTKKIIVDVRPGSKYASAGSHEKV